MSLLARLKGNVTLCPANPTINVMRTDAKAFWQISKSRLGGDLLLGGASQCLRRKNSDQLHVLVSVVKLVNMLEEKNCTHAEIARCHPTAARRSGLRADALPPVSQRLPPLLLARTRTAFAA